MANNPSTELVGGVDGSYVNWPSIVLGATVATAFSTIFLTFGTAVGLSMASTSPTWRDASVALWLLSGVYLIIVAAISFGIGGYITGYTSNSTLIGKPVEIENRDGTLGLASWALAVLLTVVIAALVSGASSSRSTIAPDRNVSSSPEPMLSYEIDRMLRPTRRSPSTNFRSERAEAGRILLTSSSHSGVNSEDRGYLVQLVAAVTGLAPPESQARVDTAISNARKAISSTRRSGVILAFSIAAALLLGAVISWVAAYEGGQHRDGRSMPSWMKVRPR